MLRLRPSDERGHAVHGWLDSRFTFSFADYHDPAHMGFGALRVVNEDRVQPGQGFAPHSHRDMEIITYVIEGALEHRDSLGNGSVIRPGEVQLMRAGTGVTHSEINPSASEPVHLLQIWVIPEARGLPPAYAQREFPLAERRGRLRPVVSPDGAEGALRIRQDATLYATRLAPGDRVAHAIAPGRRAWVQLVSGRLEANGRALAAGDGLAVEAEESLELVAEEESEGLVFDLA